MILISSNINDVVKKLLFIVFVVGLVISHYSSTFVFFFVFNFNITNFKVYGQN